MTEHRRDILALSCAISAGIHAGLTPDHVRENVAAGVGFAASAVALAVLAVVLSRNPSRFSIDATIAVLGGLIVAYVLAVTTGIPVLVPEPEPVDALALLTKAVEIIGLGVAVSIRGAFLPRFRPIPVALVALVVAFSAVAAVAVSRGHHGHAHDPAHHHSEG